MKKTIMLLTAVFLLAVARLAAADKWTGLSKYDSQNATLVAARNMGNRVVFMEIGRAHV